jgi:DNA-binding NtrC family response regulator
VSSIVLLGLDDDLAEPLTNVMRSLGHEVRATSSMVAALGDRDAQILFFGGDGPQWRDTFRELSERRPDLAIVIVNRFPDYNRWIDALELGAADYCSPPFKTIQVRWVVNEALRVRAGQEWCGSSPLKSIVAAP